MNFVSKLQYHISYIFREIGRQIALRSDRFTVLNESGSPNMVVKMYFNFFRFFLNVQAVRMLSRRLIYITANSNIVGFIHLQFYMMNILYLYCYYKL